MGMGRRLTGPSGRAVRAVARDWFDYGLAVCSGRIASTSSGTRTP